MSRYIDKDLLEKKLLSMYDETQPRNEYITGYDDCICTVRDIVSDMPEADVVKVKRGKWLPDVDVWECSVCHKWVDLLHGTGKMNYCLNCGAKMDGDI